MLTQSHEVGATILDGGTYSIGSLPQFGLGSILLHLASCDGMGLSKPISTNIFIFYCYFKTKGEKPIPMH